MHVCGGHTLTIDTATTETIVLSAGQAISLPPPIGVEEGVRCDHGALIHNTGAMAGQ